MVHTQHFCAKCSNASIRRNDSKKGQFKYQCTTCRYQGLFVPAAVRKATQYAQVDALLSERHLQRSISLAHCAGTAPALRRARAQVLLLQQVAGYAHGSD